MFLPENVDRKKKEDNERKIALRKIEAWSMEIIPSEIRDFAIVAAREIACGDPECSPLDTAVTIAFEKGLDGIFGIPMMAKDITKDDLQMNFPSPVVLRKGCRGEEAEWPPLDNEELFEEQYQFELPPLRFALGSRVLCRIGPDVERDWLPGTITQLWYRAASWPADSFAPYQIRLDDGRDIFAPADIDNVVRIIAH